MIRFIRKNKTSDQVGWTPVHLMREARAGRFPQPVQIGPNSVGFVESEVDEWMKARVEQRNNTDFISISSSAKVEPVSGWTSIGSATKPLINKMKPTRLATDNLDVECSAASNLGRRHD